MRNIASIFGRHEFAVRRLHSLTGLIPVGGFLVVHLATNASILDGPRLSGPRRPDPQHRARHAACSWNGLFIFLPILFHGLIGLMIVAARQTQRAALPLPREPPLHAAALDAA